MYGCQSANPNRLKNGILCASCKKTYCDSNLTLQQVQAYFIPFQESINGINGIKTEHEKSRSRRRREVVDVNFSSSGDDGFDDLFDMECYTGTISPTPFKPSFSLEAIGKLVEEKEKEKKSRPQNVCDPSESITDDCKNPNKT